MICENHSFIVLYCTCHLRLLAKSTSVIAPRKPYKAKRSKSILTKHERLPESGFDFSSPRRSADVCAGILQCLCMFTETWAYSIETLCVYLLYLSKHHNISQQSTRAGIQELNSHSFSIEKQPDTSSENTSLGFQI